MSETTTGRETAAAHGRGMAVSTLVVSGGISWGVNIWHAFDKAPGGRVSWGFAVLATLYGTAPVVLAAFQSHSAAFTPMGKAKKVLTYLLVLLGMLLSIQAQAAAVEVFAGVDLKWVFPIFVDLSAFMALHTLMSSAGVVGVRVPDVPDRPRTDPAASAEKAPATALTPPPVAPRVPPLVSPPALPALPSSTAPLVGYSQGRGKGAEEGVAVPREGGTRKAAKAAPKPSRKTAPAPGMSVEEIAADVVEYAAQKFPKGRPGVGPIRSAYGVGAPKATLVRDLLAEQFPEGSPWPPAAPTRLHAVPAEEPPPGDGEEGGAEGVA